MMNRLRTDLATARRRLACLHHLATFLTLELVAGMTALVWGVVVLLPYRTFEAMRYAAFDPRNERVWGLYFVGVGLAVVWGALTRSHRTRFVLDVVASFAFAQMAWRIAHGGEPVVPASAVYALVGVMLPLACALWHLLVMVIDDIVAIPPHVRQAWLEE